MRKKQQDGKKRHNDALFPYHTCSSVVSRKMLEDNPLSSRDQTQKNFKNKKRQWTDNSNITNNKYITQLEYFQLTTMHFSQLNSIFKENSYQHASSRRHILFFTGMYTSRAHVARHRSSGRIGTLGSEKMLYTKANI